MRRDLPFIRLVHWCDHFDQCYPLNRFLVLLIAEFIGTSPSRGFQGTIWNERAVEWGECDRDHHVGLLNASPERKADACYGQDHRIRLVGAPRCNLSDVLWSTTHPSTSETFNVVFVRYGVEQQDIGNQAQVRQILPGLVLL